MVVICILCNARLDFPPSGNEKPEAGAVCSSRCGHVFHNECLKDSWYKNSPAEVPLPESFQVSCVVCSNKYRPAVFPIFPSTREITFAGISAEETQNQEVLNLREVSEVMTLTADKMEKELEEKDDKLVGLKGLLESLRCSIQEKKQPKPMSNRLELELFFPRNALDKNANDQKMDISESILPMNETQKKRNPLKRLLQPKIKKQVSPSGSGTRRKYALRSKSQKS